MARACAAQTNATYLKLAGPQLVQVYFLWLLPSIQWRQWFGHSGEFVLRIFFWFLACFSAINDENGSIAHCWSLRRVFSKDMFFFQHRCS
jgi:hypothetical protein